MANSAPSRFGTIANAGDAKALFLKVFGGEVLTAFEETNVMMPRHTVRTIASGKSAQFPTTGKFSAAYHTPGQELLGTLNNHNERIITIDDLLVAHTFIASIDDAMNHFDVRSIYSQRLGAALAVQMDKHLLQQAVLAARAAGVSGAPGGTTLNRTAVGATNFATSSGDLVKALFMAAQVLDEKDVPQEGRYAFVRPAQYYLLAQNTDILNKDWGGAGVYADAKVLRVAGLEIVMSNHLPSTNLATNTGVEAGTDLKYRGDFTNVTALVMQKEAIGTVKLMDLAMESEYDIRRQGTLMVARYAVGHGILRPESAVEIRNVV
jgi:hypothetical protein